MKDPGIKHDRPLLVRALHLHPIHLLRPLLPRLVRRLLEPHTVRDLPIQIRPRLLNRDERHPHAHLHLPRPLLKPHEPRKQRALPAPRALSNSPVMRYTPTREAAIEPRDEVPRPARGAVVRVDEEVLALGVRAVHLARGGVDRERAERVGDVGGVGGAEDLCARRFDQDVGRLRAVEREAQVADARCCQCRGERERARLASAEGAVGIW